MTISKELYLALLSMDAYNRGYGAGITDGGDNDPDGLGESGQIGSASIVNPLSVGRGQAAYDAWQTAGFYAVAYDDPTHGTIISYRGTDNPSLYASDASGKADITLT